MRARDWLRGIPEVACEEREQAILEAVRDGLALPTEWCDVPTSHGEHAGMLRVGADVLRVGEPGDFVRVSLSARTAQRVCDLCGWTLPTTRICDLLWKAARKVEPALQPATGSERLLRGYSADMSDTEAMARHSEDVTRLAGPEPGLFENAGKHWVLSNSLLKRAGRAANYGWFTATAPYFGPGGLPMWQTLGLFHNLDHVDYSQTLRPVTEYMLVDGEKRPVREVASDPELWRLVSHEGPLKLSRLPGVGSELHAALPAPEPPPERRRLLFTRLVRQHAYGEDVREWQRFLGVGVDGFFGPITHNATRAWQDAHGLRPDGVVGPLTVARANESLSIQEAGASEGSLIDDFVPTRQFTAATDRRIDWVVLHSAEIEERPNSAEALAAWLAGPQAPRASWHFAADCDSVVQSVREADIAWHAPGANRAGIGIEHAGFARQSAQQWLDSYSRPMLLRSARLVAHLCRKYELPVRFVGRQGLVKGERGITTHNEVSFAWRKTDHIDPGPHFPLEWYLGQVAEALAKS